MSTLKLALATVLTLALLAAPAHAESPHQAPAAKLALVAPPVPPTVALVDKPRSNAKDTAPTTSTSGGTTWWPWAIVAAGAAGVAAAIFLTSGRDPSCPSGRVCQ